VFLATAGSDCHWERLDGVAGAASTAHMPLAAPVLRPMHKKHPLLYSTILPCNSRHLRALAGPGWLGWQISSCIVSTRCGTGGAAMWLLLGLGAKSKSNR
jgi:hypothetical protein